jgi:hypothetical protein
MNNELVQLLRQALEALSPMEKLFRQAEALHGTILPASGAIDFQITTADLRAALGAAHALRDALGLPIAQERGKTRPEPDESLKANPAFREKP